LGELIGTGVALARRKTPGGVVIRAGQTRRLLGSGGWCGRLASLAPVPLPLPEERQAGLHGGGGASSPSARARRPQVR